MSAYDRDDEIQTHLDSLIDQGVTVSEYLEANPHLDDQTVSALETARILRGAPRVGPSAEFRVVARQRMLSMIATDRQTAQLMSSYRAQQPRHKVIAWPLPSLMRALAALVVIALALFGTSEAALAAPPDSPLYPAKLVVEEVQFALATSDEQRVQLRMTFAERRMTELTTLTLSGSSESVLKAAERYRAAVRLAVEAAGDEGVSGDVARNLEARLTVQQAKLNQAARSGKLDEQSRHELDETSGQLMRDLEDLRHQVESKTPPGQAEDKEHGNATPPGQMRSTPDGTSSTDEGGGSGGAVPTRGKDTAPGLEKKTTPESAGESTTGKGTAPGQEKKLDPETVAGPSPIPTPEPTKVKETGQGDDVTKPANELPPQAQPTKKKDAEPSPTVEAATPQPEPTKKNEPSGQPPKPEEKTNPSSGQGGNSGNSGKKK